MPAAALTPAAGAPGATLHSMRGYLALPLAELPTALAADAATHVPPHARLARDRRDGAGCYHVTVATCAEWRALCEAHGEGALVAQATAVATDGLRLGGVGSARRGAAQCWFLVAEWAAARAWREAHGLAPRDFHVTLGFEEQDLHGVPKDGTTLLDKDTRERAIERRWCAAAADGEALHAAAAGAKSPEPSPPSGRGLQAALPRQDFSTCSEIDVLVLVGPPGSGKSTFAKQLARGKDWRQINQDELGKKGCVRVARKLALQRRSGSGKRIVLDRPVQSKIRVPLFAARTLKCHRPILGHAIAAVRELKSSPWASAGEKGG